MKKLIVVGNKILTNDISESVDSFDFVVRLNRMNNWGMTGKRTDLLLVDPHNLFFQLVENDHSKYHTPNQLLVNKHFLTPKNLTKLLKMDIFDYGKLMHASKIDFQTYKKELYRRLTGDDIQNTEFTNFFALLNYMFDRNGDEFDIWFTGVDVEKRGSLFKTDDTWSFHRDIGAVEEHFLKKFLKDGRIHQLDK